MYTVREFARLSTFSLAALLSLSTRPVFGQTLGDKELGALLDKETLTKEDHLKLAAHYSSEAEQLAKNAERHAGVANRYRRAGKLSPKVAQDFRGMGRHCEDLSQSLSKASKAAQEIAVAHRAMAEESQ